MPEFRKRLTLEAIINTVSQANADVMVEALKVRLAKALIDVAVEDDSPLFGMSTATLALSERPAESVRGPRRPKAAPAEERQSALPLPEPIAPETAPEPSQAEEPWLAVGKWVLIPHGMAPEHAVKIYAGGSGQCFATGIVTEIVCRYPDRPGTVEVMFAATGGGSESVIVSEADVSQGPTGDRLAEWPQPGDAALIPEATAAGAMNGCAIVDGYARGTVVSLTEDDCALVLVEMVEGEPQELLFFPEILSRPSALGLADKLMAERLKRKSASVAQSATE